jgi:hypothetical protein
MSNADRNELRARELAALPRWYSPLIHVLSPSACGVMALVACALLVKELRWQELLTVPIVLVLSNMAEWRIHRDLLHKRHRLAPALYDRHTPVHHRIYVREDMEIKEWRELKFILIPAWAAVVLFVGLLPLATALWFFVAPNVAYIFMATCMLYVVTYELLHMSYHLPTGSLVGRNPVIRALARHHSTHHDPRLMLTWNMNVSVPLWDLVRRTTWRDQTETPGDKGTPRVGAGLPSG